jgi:hypothetical protein
MFLKMSAMSIMHILLCCVVSSIWSVAFAQTYTSCDPLKASNCQPCKALGRAVAIDFTKGPSPLFRHVSSPEQVRYTKEGVEFIVSKKGNNPTIQSDFYIMFGRVEVILRASPGVGIVSSFVLQSDDLDEIDLEWLGGEPRQFQTNFFSKGDTSTYDRGEFHSCDAPQLFFHNYTMDWTDQQTTWYLDGHPMRVLPSSSPSGYPQTPMAIRIGSWAGGDPSNPPGTIEWAGGVSDYGLGPFVFTVRSLLVKDYSTGFMYTYGDQSGAWTSIQAVGGEIKGDAGFSPEEFRYPSTNVYRLAQHRAYFSDTAYPIRQNQIFTINGERVPTPGTDNATLRLVVTASDSKTLHPAATLFTACLAWMVIQ